MPTPVATPLAPGDTAPGDHLDAGPLDALPVALGAGPLRDRLRRFVEGELGWQVVAPGDSDLPPRLVLATVTMERRLEVPHVLVVGSNEDPTEAARACVRLRPEGIVAWPDGRGSLPDAVADLLARPAPRRSTASATVTTVGGAAGGVGTTTVTVALAAASAWAGRRSLAVVRPPVALDVATHPAEVRASARLWASADGVPGVRGARVSCCLDTPEVALGDVPDADAMVRDRGVDTDVDVLVVRPDRIGLASLRATVASVVVVNGGGPVPVEVLRRAAAGRRLVRLELSVRVSRADLRGRGPGAYPGSWLRPLLPIARGPTR